MCAGPWVAAPPAAAAAGAAPPSIDTPALVERIRAASRWADRARSLRIEWTDRWLSPEETSARLARLGDGGATSLAPDPAAPDAGREGGGAILFDDNRARIDVRMPITKGVSQTIRCFDGEEAWQFTRPIVPGETHPRPEAQHLVLCATAREALGDSIGLAAWPVTENRSWWIGFGQANTAEHAAADFSVIGTSVIDGSACLVLGGARFADRWHVDRATGDCRAFEQRVIGDPGAGRRAQETIRRERSLAALEPREYFAWTQSLSPDERRTVDERYCELIAPSLRPLHTLLLGDWREVVPGGRFPFRQGVVFHGDHGDHGDGLPGAEEAPIRLRLTLVTRVAIDEPLPDDAFAAPSRSEGMQVEDMRLGGTVRWRHPHAPTEEQRRALAAEARAQIDDFKRDEVARNALIGTPAPTFDAAGAWLNGRPPAAETFAGRVTVVTFTSRSCGPCQSVLPAAKALNLQQAQRAASAVDVIAVHAADDVQRVERYVQDKRIEYPVYIDQPSPGGGSFGRLFDAWRVTGIPRTFVVGTDGRIKGHGDFQRMADLARELAGAQPSKPTS